MEPKPTCIHIRRDGDRCENRRYGQMDMCEKHTTEFIMDAVFYGKLPDEALAALRADVAEYFISRYEFARSTSDHDERSARRLKNEADPWLVYYIRRGGDIIKIGTSRNLPQRLAQLYAEPDDVLATEPGGHRIETQRHRQFAHLRHARTELFDDCKELRDWIDQVKAAHGEPTLTRHVA